MTYIVLLKNIPKHKPNAETVKARTILDLFHPSKPRLHVPAMLPAKLANLHSWR